MPDHEVLFGVSLGQWNGADAADAAGRIRLATQADRDGLDLFTVADHPYFGDKLDAYALTGFLLSRTERITGMVTVTNLPSRPAPVLARTLTSLSALSGGRVILGIGAGAIWDMIVKLGRPLSQIFAGLQERVGPHAYARHDIHLNRETYDRERVRILSTLESHEPSEVAGVKVERIRSDDGFKFYLADGSWVLLRASGTEALVRVYAEAADKAAVEARLAALEDIVGLRAHA